MRAPLAAVLVLMLAVLPVAAASLEERLAPCLACHGGHGQSAQPEVPSLGAQPAFYVMVQLYMFRERMRTVEVMNAITQGLTDDELRSMAEVIAKLPPPQPVAEAGDPARLERARALIQQHRCAFCHNPDYSGAQQVPRLAGQREDYLVKALREYKNNTRRGYDPAMAEVLYAISDEQLRDLAYLLARFQ
ncbi:MAG TPA: c-type cytochrome [Candidatus Tectomicrobia bacterium]|jgi:cytochrome c553